MKTIVVGAGIVGASVAWHLARSGEQVVVIDGGLSAASHASFGWINASFYADAAHHRLRAASLQRYRTLLDQVPHLPVHPCGALWSEAQGDPLHDMRKSLQGFDYPVDYADNSEAAALEPDLCDLPPEVLIFPSESAADPAAVAHVLLRESGAQILRGVRVSGVLGGAQVRGAQTNMGVVEGDRVVIAAGNGAPDILASVGVKLPMLMRPGVMVTTKPVTARINHILVTPHGEARQLHDGRIMASAVANHQGDDATDVVETPDQIATRVLGWLSPMIKGGVAGWDEVTLGYRPVPQDGLPVIGAVGPKGLHVAVMHSGVTLAAIAGEITAAQVLGRASPDQIALVAPYLPHRFQ